MKPALLDGSTLHDFIFLPIVEAAGATGRQGTYFETPFVSALLNELPPATHAHAIEAFALTVVRYARSAPGMREAEAEAVGEKREAGAGASGGSTHGISHQRDTRGLLQHLLLVFLHGLGGGRRLSSRRRLGSRHRLGCLGSLGCSGHGA